MLVPKSARKSLEGGWIDFSTFRWNWVGVAEYLDSVLSDLSSGVRTGNLSVQHFAYREMLKC